MPLPPLSPQARRSLLALPACLGCLLGAVTLGVDLLPDAYARKPKLDIRPAPFVVDENGLEAVSLAQDWRIAGDDLPVLQRLGGVVRHPNGRRAWSAERTDEGSYLVIYREPAGTPAYAFEVDLESEAVRPTPEAVDWLTRLRVHAEASAQIELLAQAK